MKKWMVASKRADFDAIAAKYNIDKVIARIIRNRDVVTDGDIDIFLNGTLRDLHDPALLKDMDKAVAVIKKAIDEGVRIRVMGDFDVDGICATFILYRGLSALGAQVDTDIPDRIRDGYGINDNMVKRAGEDNTGLIITCDNGIAAKAQIDLATSLGIEVVITDHHEVPYDIVDDKRVYILPEACAVVDPKRDDCPYPFKAICGAVVAYKLMQSLLDDSVVSQKEALDEMLPFAALATVCDIMELKDENRIIVKYGLDAMQNTANQGLKALLGVNELTGKKIGTYHAGFILGPCINSTGRLDSAKRALELFTKDKYEDAAMIARELKELNASRKLMTEEGARQAVEAIENSNIKNDRVMVVYMENTHESLAGIIAGRLRERYNRPVFVVTKSEEGVKGSGRSIESYDMYGALTRVKDLFVRFGGHRMAAGITLQSVDKLYEMRRRLNEDCILTDDDLTAKIHIDVPMPLSYISEELIEGLGVLEPFGAGNPKPVFATANISLISYDKLGKNKNVGKFRIKDETGRNYDMIYFGDLDELEGFLADKYDSTIPDLLSKRQVEPGRVMLDIVYYPQINEYGNNRSIQIVMDEYR
ncbi:MAG: single-stranded-DNA-specific exonuclease RecJ [Lachnospiraceae bacterium]|nr:single-stranded-DNA-specific exonuclease RecJ [Lachnospiraceae bacterium]